MNQFRKEDKLFLKHSIYNLNNHDLLNIFKNKGLEFKEEENGRCFPITEDSNSVLSILKEYLEELNVDVLLNFHVKSIIKKKNEKIKNKSK
nr:NAD(P)/FAD-dependent oxidoreductase [Methanobrevibacter arboriphilus]